MKRAVMVMSLVLAALIADAASCANPTTWDGAMARQVGVKIKDMPLSDAVGLLLKNTGISYTVDPEVNKLKVTAILKNVSLEKALGEVTRAAGVSYHKVSDKSLKISAPQSRETICVPTVQKAPRTFTGEVAVVMTLKYVTPGDVAAVVSKLARVEMVSSSGSQILLVGDRDAVSRAETLVRMLDVPESLPRPVKISVDVLINDLNSSASRVVSMSNTGPEGTNILLENSAGSEEPSKRESNPRIDILMLVKPIVPPDLKADDHITLSGQGTISETVQGVQTTRNFSFKAAVAPGRPVVVTSGSVNSEGFCHSYEISISANVEDGRLRVRPNESRPDDVVRVLGAVKKPGVYGFAGGMHFWDAVNLAGGLSPDADEKRIVIRRNGAKDEIQISHPLPDKGVRLDNPALEPGDTIYVPPVK